ncbi:MAG: MBL fold metallo-hydrolase [Methanotrichaceae archaeon]|nr:MBL fold metallo-hydrolase [Methanotrichaceae archaeon]
MLFERFVSKGLAHYSYMIGDRNEAAVIDPKRDCETYIEQATAAGLKISYILETHRNEDYFVGSAELASRTGAEIWHADGQWDYKYGQSAEHGQKWDVGRLKIEAIQTPGHTPGSISYLLHDPSGVPWVVFTGDILFADEIGRIDLLGIVQAPALASQIYDSIFNKLLPLGDGIIVCPAHGAGSVCGESIAERLWTTIGLEKEHNYRLKIKDQKKFVESLLKSQPERPPYFSMMEKVNLEGRPILGALPAVKPISPKNFELLAKGAQIVDTRRELGFGAAHVPGAQFIWLDGLASFAGWYLSYDKPILLVNETDDPEEATRILVRLGYENIAGYLAGGMLNWHISGQSSQSITTLSIQESCTSLDKDENVWILDVRSDKELDEKGSIAGAQHIHITQIPARYTEVPDDRPIYVFCGSGLRSMVVASYLQNRGYKDLAVILGGMAGWKSIRCPILKK